MEERNHSGKWKSLYSKAVQDLSSAENNVQGAPSPVSQENVSQILSDLNSKDNLSKEQIFIHKQTLKSIVQDLHNQNSNLRHKLEKLQTSNAKGLEKLKHFYDENNKLKTELKLIATRKDQNTSDHAKVQYELNSEIKNLNTKLKFEQAQRDELKRRYVITPMNKRRFGFVEIYLLIKMIRMKNL
jgi:predicted RNase H-like nuclease (RuvC/YqgF family)